MFLSCILGLFFHPRAIKFYWRGKTSFMLNTFTCVCCRVCLAEVYQDKALTEDFMNRENNYEDPQVRGRPSKRSQSASCCWDSWVLCFGCCDFTASLLWTLKNSIGIKMQHHCCFGSKVDTGSFPKAQHSTSGPLKCCFFIVLVYKHPWLSISMHWFYCWVFFFHLLSLVIWAIKHFSFLCSLILVPCWNNVLACPDSISQKIFFLFPSFLWLISSTTSPWKVVYTFSASNSILNAKLSEVRHSRQDFLGFYPGMTTDIAVRKPQPVLLVVCVQTE